MYTGPLRSLIDELGRLPGIGPKSAQRIAFHVLKVPSEDARRLADAIVAVKERTTLCEICFNVAEGGALCAVCSDDRRDPDVVCVVEDPRDIVAVERTGFKGRYHVLGGALSPLDGIGRDQLRLQELLDRVEQGAIREAIVCTNPTIEGEATAMQVAKELRPLRRHGLAPGQWTARRRRPRIRRRADARARPRGSPAPGGADAAPSSKSVTRSRSNWPMRIAIVGATGQVGVVLRSILAERRFPVDSMRYLASARSAGTTLPWADTEVVVEDAETADLSGIDFALCSAPASVSRELAPRLAAAGAIGHRQLLGLAHGSRRAPRRPRGQRRGAARPSPRASWPTRTAPPWWPSRSSSPCTTRPA